MVDLPAPIPHVKVTRITWRPRSKCRWCVQVTAWVHRPAGPEFYSAARCARTKRHAHNMGQEMVWQIP